MLADAILKKADASTCNELRKALQGYGLSIYGNKETLMRRLKSHHKIIKKKKNQPDKSNKKMTKKSVDKILPENEDGTKNCTVIITNDEKNLADHYSKDQGASKTKNDIGSPTSGTEISSKNQSPSKYEEKVEQDTGMIPNLESNSIDCNDYVSNVQNNIPKLTEQIPNSKEMKKEPEDENINNKSENDFSDSGGISDSQIEINDQSPKSRIDPNDYLFDSEILLKEEIKLDDEKTSDVEKKVPKLNENSKSENAEKHDATLNIGTKQGLTQPTVPKLNDNKMAETVENKTEEIKLVNSKTKVEIAFQENVYRIRIPKVSVTLSDIKKHLMSQPEKFGMSQEVKYDFSVKLIENGKVIIEEIDDDMNEDILSLFEGKIVLNCWAKT